MDNETDIIEKYVKNLSKGMRDYLAKNTWPQKLSLIAQMNKMTDEQSSELNTEVLLVLVGIENHSDFKTNIQKNVAGIGYENIGDIVKDIENGIFSEVRPLLDEIETANNAAGGDDEEDLNKDSVLHGIENPVPTKPFVQNPAGKNPILDAQHNLPEQERKILISSAAVPSRGPMLNNFKTGFGVAPASPTAAPAAVRLFSQPQQPPQMPKPSAPDKYTIDPYRELAE